MNDVRVGEVGVSRVSAIYVLEEVEVQALVPHPTVDVHESRGGGLHDDRDRLDEKRHDLRETEGCDNADDRRCALITRGGDHRCQRGGEERERDADDLCDGTENERYEHQDSQDHPEPAP